MRVMGVWHGKAEGRGRILTMGGGEGDKRHGRVGSREG